MLNNQLEDVCTAWGLCQKLSLSYTLIKLYYTKALSNQASSLAPDEFFSSGGKNPSVFYGSATNFHLGGSSGILQDKVRMPGALVLCSPNRPVFCCTSLTLQCACVYE